MSHTPIPSSIYPHLSNVRLIPRSHNYTDMGLEQDLKKEMRLTKVREAILLSLKVGGVLAISVMAPNVAGQLGKTYTSYQRKRTRDALARLSEKGLVSFTDGLVRLTAKGQDYLDRQLLQERRPQRWDKKWRIVIFDIPETRKASRNALRDMLKHIGFRKLQQSTWLYPYDCEELVSLLKTDYKLGKEVLYIIADKIENDVKFRKAFGVR